MIPLLVLPVQRRVLSDRRPATIAASSRRSSRGSVAAHRACLRFPQDQLVLETPGGVQQTLNTPKIILVIANSFTNEGSARNEVRGRARTTNELYLMDAVIEPERLAQISLGQENPRRRMNAAPGSRTIRTRTLKGFHNTVLCSPFRANALLPKNLGRCPRLTCCGPLGQIAVFQWAFKSSWACVVCHTSR